MGPIRQRKALSCVDCRRRKVKCDRTLPVCNRCQKTGNTDSCTYVPYTGSSADQILTPSDDGTDQHREEPREDIEPLLAIWGRQNHIRRTIPNQHRSAPVVAVSNQAKKGSSNLDQLSARIVELENQIRSSGIRATPRNMTLGISNPIIPDSLNDRNPTCDSDRLMIRGNGFSTQYFGPSFPISMLLQFDELSRFVKEVVLEVLDLKAAKQSLAAIRKPLADVENERILHDLESLVNMVPDRAQADKLVKQYLTTWETTYRVLHVPSFLQKYQEFWHTPSQSEPEFVTILLLVMATVYCVVPGGPTGFVGRSSAAREVALRWITACEGWLHEQSWKHMTLSHLQIHVLIYVARRMSCIKPKREWTNSGHLLRLAMGAGMHREPTLLCKKGTVFISEMRRRLWFTIVELDLQSTLNKGMTSNIDATGWDCQPPRDINDEDFDESTDRLPTSTNKRQATRTSFLHFASSHLALRMEILARVNNIRLGLDLETVMQYDNKLREIIDRIPPWDPSDDTTSTSFARSELELVLYEYILILHVPFASQIMNKARYLYSIASKRDACLKTLKIYSSLPTTDAIQMSHWRDDGCRAALTLCHDIVSSTAGNNSSPTDHTSALNLIAGILEIFSERIKNLGQTFHSFWAITTAYALAQAKISTTQPQIFYAREASVRVNSVLYDTILSGQVPMPLSNGAQVVDDSVVPYIPDDTVLGLDGPNAVGDPLLDLMDFDFASVWNLDFYQSFADSTGI